MNLFEFDNEYKKTYNVICGIDEAGRGPLAGDLFCAAVILKDNIIINGLNDSKKLSEKKREYLYNEILDKSVCYSIETVSVKEIDEINILNATMLGMKNAYCNLNNTAGITLVDGNKLPLLPCPAEFVISGDAKSASIAAASILAKVSRDRYMMKLHELYPMYCFDKHKGYGTKLHIEMILKYGPSPVHRISFLKKIYQKYGDNLNSL